MEIINLLNCCKKTDVKARVRTGAKADVKVALKNPRSEYHFFPREQVYKMVEEDGRNYRSIVSKRWKHIK